MAFSEEKTLMCLTFLTGKVTSYQDKERSFNRVMLIYREMEISSVYFTPVALLKVGGR